MKNCLICGKEIESNRGIFFDGYWFDCEECVKVYCAFMGIEYAQPEQSFINDAA